jgi:hypothetical protein
MRPAGRAIFTSLNYRNLDVASPSCLSGNPLADSTTAKARPLARTPNPISSEDEATDEPPRTPHAARKLQGRAPSGIPNKPQPCGSAPARQRHVFATPPGPGTFSFVLVRETTTATRRCVCRPHAPCGVLSQTERTTPSFVLVVVTDHDGKPQAWPGATLQRWPTTQ